MKRIAIDIPKKLKLIVIGNGMAGFKFCEKFIKYRLSKKYDLIVFGEEYYPAYDRVNLTSFFIRPVAEELLMAPASWYYGNKIDLRKGEQVVNISRDEKYVTTSAGNTETYDLLILATGSLPFVPHITGVNLEGVFVYRTIDDLKKILDFIPSIKKAVVIGGGILGLEAARALLHEDLSVSVIEIASRLMPRQLDETASELLLARLRSMGLNILVQQKIESLEGDHKVSHVRFSDGMLEEAGMVIISAGIIPRDELARKAGLKIGQSGGVVVNDHTLTSDASIYAIGECALIQGKIWGLAAPCFEMADVLAARLSGIFKVFSDDTRFSKLKVAETNVISFGDSLAQEGPSDSFTQIDKTAGIYRKINVSKDKKRLLGGILIGNVAGYANMLQIMRDKGRITTGPETFMNILSADSAPKIIDLPDNTRICMCEEVSKEELMKAIRQNNITNLDQIRKMTKAGTGCESCVCVLEELLKEHMDC